MKKLILILAILALTATPVIAHVGGSQSGFQGKGRFGGQGRVVWRPFFYPGPAIPAYPRGFTYGYPGPYFVTDGDPGPYTYGYPPPYTYTYGYPGPYSYGIYGYSRPHCSPRLDGYWDCR